MAVFVAAMIGQLLASALGAALRSRVNWRPATLIDSVAGGAAVSVLSVPLIAWLIGSAVVNAPFAMVTNQVNRSAVLRTVDGVMLSAARTMFSDFRSLLASGPYVQVFGALGAEPRDRGRAGPRRAQRPRAGHGPGQHRQGHWRRTELLPAHRGIRGS